MRAENIGRHLVHDSSSGFTPSDSQTQGGLGEAQAVSSSVKQYFRRWAEIAGDLVQSAPVHSCCATKVVATRPFRVLAKAVPILLLQVDTVNVEGSEISVKDRTLERYARKMTG